MTLKMPAMAAVAVLAVAFLGGTNRNGWFNFCCTITAVSADSLVAFCRHLEGIFSKTNLHTFVWHLNLHCYVNVMGIFMCVLFVFWGIL